MTPTAERTSSLADGRILGLIAFLALPVALFAPKGMAPLFGVAGLSCLIANLAHKRGWPVMAGWSMALAAGFAMLSAASAIWSMTPGVSLKGALVLGLVLILGLLLASTARRLQGASKHAFETGLIAGGVLGLAIIGIEVSFGDPLYSAALRLIGRPPETAAVLLRSINQGAAVTAIFLLPWAVVVRRRFGSAWAGVGLAVGVGVLAACEADSQKVALVVGLAAALITLLGGKSALRGFSVLFVVGVLSAPWVVTMLPDPLQPNNSAAVLPGSSQHRLVIWQTTAGLIFKRPLLGSGFDTARAFYGADKKVEYHFGGEGANTKWANLFEPIPLHPHNGVLQVWLELGLVGALLFAGSLFFIMGRLAVIRNNFERSMLSGAFVTGLTIFSVSYGAWQGWWLGAIWLMIAFGVASVADPTDDGARERP